MDKKVVKTTNITTPLAEALFELRWVLVKSPNGALYDPNYKLLIGILYNEFLKKYPSYEQLPTSSMPEEISAGIVQHRFRSVKNGWPLIQLGPGVLTFNETKKYNWRDFKKRVSESVNILAKNYPDKKTFTLNKVMLRYIGTTDFDFEKDNIEKYLKEKLKIDISLNKELFKNKNIESIPRKLNLAFSFNCKQPLSKIKLSIISGKKESKNALIWDIVIQSTGEQTPSTDKLLDKWLEQSNTIINDWFYKLSDTKLE